MPLTAATTLPSHSMLTPYSHASPGSCTSGVRRAAFSQVMIPGTPAYVARAATFRLRHEDLGLDLALKGHNAVQGSFRFEA